METVEQTKKLDLELELIDTLLVESASPNITIIGDAKVSSIIVEASIVMSKKDQDNYVLSLEKEDAKAVLKAAFKSSNDEVNQSMDVRVMVPPELNLHVNDQSGKLEIINIIEQVSINDESGDIILENINGRLEIRDGSGSVIIKNSQDIAVIEDLTGDIDIIESAGNTRITDGSGDLNIIDFEGDLDILDGNGDLTVTNVIGSVTVDDGSGDISISNIARDVKIVNAGSGELTTAAIKGEFIQE
ncbi:hypothetical protein [Bacillus carboniphilus]|uniref:hypothetical protein n=1 Tax=Bacillus carboniphilus TaxID=86663 RepID=UPI0031E2EFBF